MKLGQFLLLLVGLVFLGSALLLGFNFVLMPRLIHRNEVVLMPDLRGMTVADAETQAHTLHLQVHATRARPHPTIAAGMILEQLPAPSVPIRRGRMVRVITSSGPPAGTVPNLTGLTVHQAEITLQREAYRLGRILRIRRDEVSEPRDLHAPSLRGASRPLSTRAPAPTSICPRDGSSTWSSPNRDRSRNCVCLTCAVPRSIGCVRPLPRPVVSSRR